MVEAHSYVGNTEEENNGYVVFKGKNPRIRREKRVGARGEALLSPSPPPPQPFLQQASGLIFKDDVNSFPPPRIFASCLQLTKRLTGLPIVLHIRE
jgi:hypothetical protein